MSMLISRLITGPTAEPIDLTVAKAHLRLEVTNDDDYVTSLIQAAREYTEKATSRALINQTWELVLPGFPTEDHITLPRAPLSSVTSVKYLDVNGVEQTASAVTLYEVDDKSRRGRVILREDQVWPTTRGRWNDVTVRYVTGYGDDGTDVPMPLLQAMLLLISQMYEQRTPEVTGTIVSPVKFAYEALISPYKMEHRRP